MNTNMKYLKQNIRKEDMDEIHMILSIEKRRNHKEYTIATLISELISTFKKVNNYPTDMSEANVNSFLKARETINAQRNKK